MSWLSFALGGYFFNACATLVDKHLLSRRLPNAVIYSFYTGILSAGVLVLAPFGFSLLPVRLLLLALLAGISFVVSFYFFYHTLRIWEASRVAPLVGIFSTIVTLILSQSAFGETFGGYELLAFLFLLGAGILLVLQEEQRLIVRWDVVVGAFLAAFFLSFMFFLSKILYLQAPFISAFIWIRLGSACAAVFFLVPRATRHMIVDSQQSVGGYSLGLVAVNKIIGAIGFLAINYAVSTGSATLINSLRASEYGFVFLLVLASSVFFPWFVSEPMSMKAILQKSLGILLAGVGIAFLVISPYQ